ncbi:MAG TPA: phosphopantetheine-binding protein [Xenococcaceae cyanobacterium]|jgi:acyl carrier protein
MTQRILNTTTEQAYSAEAIKNWLVSNLAEQLGIEPAEIDVQENIADYGLDSAQAMLMVSRAEKQFGFELSPRLLWYYPTIQSLSERLAEELAESETFEI